MLPEHELFLDTPAERWDEGIPLGNGLLGAMVWGDGRPLKLTLGRSDLWDLRPVPEYNTEEYSYETMRRWVAAGRSDDLRHLFERPYSAHAGPTKLPGGQIELSLTNRIESCRLTICDAVAEFQFVGGIKIRMLVHATEPIVLIEANSADAVVSTLVSPPLFSGQGASSKEDRSDAGNNAGATLRDLGYPAAEGHGGDGFMGFRQLCWGGFSYAVCLMWRKDAAGWHGTWSMATSNEDVNPFDLAKRQCETALEKGFDVLTKTHRHWWVGFWGKSGMCLPNKLLERQWYMDMYKFGASARREAAPIALQGVWTQEGPNLPPWKGDYHHDMNVEESYWLAYSANHLDEAATLTDWLWQTKPNCERWTRRFYGMDGLNVPGTCDLNNECLGGWHQYAHSCTTAAWLAQHFYLQWRYGMDRKFLRTRAYPYLHEASIFIEAITEKGPDGLRTLPLSSSPEINDNTLDAWFPTITNYDLSLIRWLFAATAELAEELEFHDEAMRFKDLLSEMPDLYRAADDGRLLMTKEVSLHESHRHLSHLMAIYPLGIVHQDGNEDDRQTIEAALHEFDRLGTYGWAGHTFPWAACIAARAFDGSRAEKAIHRFAKDFCLRNTLHVNGDQSGTEGCKFTNRIFTLEANLGTAAAVQEMLLQSVGGGVRIFPAIPKDWPDVSFESLRAEGAFLVSANRIDGQTRYVRVLAEAGGKIILVDPFAGKKPAVELRSAETVASEQGRIVFNFQPGGYVEMCL